MSESIDVFWGYVSPNKNSQMDFFLLIEEPTPVITELKDLRSRMEPDLADSNNFLKCPAVIDSMRNIFVVKSPIDLDFEWDGNSIRTPVKDQLFFDTYIMPRSLKAGYMSLYIPNLIFITNEESLKINTLNASYSFNDFTKKCSLIGGSFDIGSWFRSIDTAFILREPCSVNIKKGDPLFYISFETDKKINFKKFLVSKKTIEYMNSCIGVKQHVSFPLITNLSNLYSLFKKSKIKSAIMREVEKNIL